MKRSKRIFVLLGVLLVACAVTFGVSRYETKKEEIQTSGEVVLEVPTDSVDSLSWENESATLSFHKEETWTYDDDAAFPVDEEKIDELLEQFQAFSASFVIENVEDFSQYGLTDPVCTIEIGTADQTYTILLGDYSAMDSERYVSIGDGNVYLVQNDPLDYFDAQLSDVIQNDEVPVFDQVSQIRVSADADYEMDYEEESADTYRQEDVYFTQIDGVNTPLDTTAVEGYLQTLEGLDLSEYVSYNATESDLESWGLTDPQLTLQIDYTTTDEEENEVSGTFALSVSRDPDEQAEADAQEEDAEAQSDETDAEEEQITAYARVGESPIVYKLTAEDYKSLMAASQDDFRHKEVVPADFEDIAQIDVVLEGESYTITTEGDADDRSYFYEDQELESDALQSAFEALQADSFTSEQPTEKEEIDLTLSLDLEGDPTVHVELYRYDGSDCLAVVDGSPLALVPRDCVVDLIEAVNAIVLNG